MRNSILVFAFVLACVLDFTAAVWLFKPKDQQKAVAAVPRLRISAAQERLLIDDSWPAEKPQLIVPFVDEKPVQPIKMESPLIVPLSVEPVVVQQPKPVQPVQVEQEYKKPSVVQKFVPQKERIYRVQVIPVGQMHGFVQRGLR